MLKIFRKLSVNGVLLAILASIVFSLSLVVLKLLSDSVPSTQAAFSRSLIGLLLVVFYMLRKGYSFKVKKKRILFLRGLFGGVAMLLYFYGVYTIKLGEVSILFQLTPVFVVILASLFLKEKMPKSFYLLIMVSIAGVAMIVKPGLEAFKGVPALLVILAAFFTGLAYMLIRYLSRENRPHIIVLSFCIMSLIVIAPFSYTFVVPDLRAMLLLILLGVVATLGQLLLTMAYSLEKAGVVSMLSYVGVLFSVFWGFLIWGERLDVYSILGGLMIIASCSILSYKIYAKTKAKPL